MADATTNTNHKHTSGATSSELKAPYHYLRLSFMRRVAVRFGLGETKHGRGNWLRAYADGTVDIGFLRDRYDHALEHFRLLGMEGTTADDHIGAVGWFLNIADEAESVGLSWADLMAVVTPEEEAAMKKRILKFYKPRRRVK